MTTTRTWWTGWICGLLLAVALATPQAAGRPDQPATWLMRLGAADAARLSSMIHEVQPAAQGVVDRLQRAVSFDGQTATCPAEDLSCSYPRQGVDGRWGIHLTGPVLSQTYQGNRFMVYHELGHAVWSLVMTQQQRDAFVAAVRASLAGKPCLDTSGRACAPIGEVFADEFARYAGGFAVSMSDYRTPAMLTPTVMQTTVLPADQG